MGSPHIDGGRRIARLLGLPPIPADYIRLTHVMPERSRQILAAGEPFLYGRYGLAGTTDAYTNNDAIEYLALTGNPMGPGSPGNWSRNDFGEHMALIDLPAAAHKKILRTLAYDRPLPNEAILGFVDRPRMEFEPNPRYSRDAIEQYAAEAGDEVRRLWDSQLRRPLRPRPEMPAPLLRPADPDIW